MTRQPSDVLGIGAVTWDRFLVVPRYPHPDDKVRAIRLEECAGGTTATALVALRRWGLRCRFVGVLGFDDYSERIVADLHSENIETDALIRRDEAEGRCTTVLVDNRTGQRSIISSPNRLPPITADLLFPDLFAGARVLHLDTSVEDCAVEAAERAKAAGLWVTLDAERPCRRTQELMRLCDYVIAPLSFARDCTGEDKTSLAAYALYLQTGKPVVVTDGERGCDYASKELSFHQPAFEVPVVDSTGAGDVFHAAFIYGLLSAWEPRKIVRFAAWAGAAACRELGARAGIPTQHAVHDYLRTDTPPFTGG